MRRWLALTLCLSFSAPSVAAADDAEDTRRAWGAFFAQTGFGLGALGGAGFVALEGEDALPAGVLLSTVFTASGSLLGHAALEGGWSPSLGWALAGLYPGAALGVAAGSMAALDQSADRALHIGVGLGIGAALGALGLWLDHALGGNPSAVLLGLWSGFTAGGLPGLGFMLTAERPEGLVAPLAGALVGALMGALLGELLR